MQLLARAVFVFAFPTGAGIALPAAGAPSSPIDIKPGPALVRYAAAHDIPLEGFELAGEGESARPNDRLTVLFTIQEGTDSRQWLGEFRFAALTDREAKSNPGTGLGILSLFQSSLKTDTGHEFRFKQTPAALEIRTHGPFASNVPAATKPAVTDARVLATRDYLAHGLAPMGPIELRLRAAGKENPGLSYVFRPKFSNEHMAAAKTRAATAGFTENDERVYAESIFALVQFANLAFTTEGVDAIVREIADPPTLFSGAFVNLDWTKLQVEDARDWNLPAAPVFRLPYKFLSKTKAVGTFYFTASRPPLLNMAGLLALTVDTTSKTPARRLTVRVLASRRGSP